MAGIAGLFHRDGRPCDRALLERFASSMGHRAEAGIEYVLAGPVGLATLRMRPALRLRSDLPGPRHADALVAFDGRIDNRARLLGRLGLRADYTCDDQLLAGLISHFGERILPDLLGDFAFAAWNPREQTLLLVRDTSGIRPLCYFEDGSTTYFASEVSAFFSLPSFEPVVNERKVAQHLLADLLDKDETVYRGVMRVPPAHVVTACIRSTSVRRYFDFDVSSTIRYRTDGEYAEHFLELFRESVHARLPEGERCGAELSGGLDSSSIVCTAAMLGHSIETFSLVFPGYECDESDQIDLVARHANVVSHRITPLPRTRSELDNEIDRIRDVPNEPNGAMHVGEYRLARSVGIRVLLTGVGGDDLFDGVSSRTAAMEALASVEVGRVFRDFDAADLCLASRDLFVRSRLGTALRPIWRRVRPRQPLPIPWIGRAVTDLAYGSSPAPRPLHDATTSSRHAAYDAITLNWLPYALEGMERSAALEGIELSYPFLDRRLAQFAINIPQEQRSKLRIRRYVAREAMRGILPEAIRVRTTKADFMHTFDRELQSTVNNHLQLDVLAPWAETRVLDIELRRYVEELRRQQEVVATPWQWQLWKAVAVSAWLNRLARVV